MPRAHRLLSPLFLVLALTAAAVALHAPPALASSTQEPIFQDDGALTRDPAGTLDLLRSLGVARVRVFVVWNSIAPSPNSTRKPHGFSPSDPNSYPAQNWGRYDAIVQAAAARGIAVDFTLTGPAPQWAVGSGGPRGAHQWKPSGSEFRSFVTAVGRRYPSVHYWAIWNEPNYGPDLAPQEIHRTGVEVAPALYRNLLDGAWSGLQASRHGRDTILIGEVAPRGITTGGQPGTFGGMVPLRFVDALYCVDSSYRPLRGSAAAARGCPTSAAGSSGFRRAHPGLFQATGFADHPYPQGLAPNRQTWPNGGQNQYFDLPQVPFLERVLDRLQRTYGSGTRLPIYSTEYGYRTGEPGQPSYAKAALYLNWAEYISYRDPRIRSFMQYLLLDPASGNFPSGLETSRGRRKATFDAFRMPLYLPSTSTRRGRTLEVWGDVRPAVFAKLDTRRAQQVQIEYQRGSRGSFKSVKAVTLTNSRGYFDVRIAFPASGSVRLGWAYPSGAVIHSRTQTVTVR
jgi:hypothetical protein